MHRYSGYTAKDPIMHSSQQPLLCTGSPENITFASFLHKYRVSLQKVPSWIYRFQVKEHPSRP